MRKLFWHNGACDPIAPFENNGIEEIEKIVEGKVFNLQWELDETGSLGVLIYVEGKTHPDYLYLDWYTP